MINRILLLITLIQMVSHPISAWAESRSIEATKKIAEQQIRHLLEPLVDKYCRDACRLMGVHVTVERAQPEEISPGFDDIPPNADELSPSSATVKFLVDDKVGPVSRDKLHDLIQQFVDTLDYPVRVDFQTTHFPMPQGTEAKIPEMRERIAKDFQGRIEVLLHEFCPNQCLLAETGLQTEAVNGEEAQYGSTEEFETNGDTTIKIKEISATILMDSSLGKQEQSNILEMLKLRTNSYKHVRLTGKTLKFPAPMLNSNGMSDESSKRRSRGLASDGSATEFSSKNQDSKTDSKHESTSRSNNETNSSDSRVEKFERVEKIEKVENGDIVIAEMQKLKYPALFFVCSVLSLLIFIAMATLKRGDSSSIHRAFQTLTSDATRSDSAPSDGGRVGTSSNRDNGNSLLSQRYEIERLTDELSSTYAQMPRVAKQVFSRILTEEGVEVTSECVHIFGECIIIEMLRDPTLQTDLTELLEHYAKNPIVLKDDRRLELLRNLHSRTIAGKLIVLGSRSTSHFDFLGEMDGLQILELIRTEPITVKAIVLTQCDPPKRATIYSQMDGDLRMKVLTELSRIDYLPKDYIFNVATALKRKRNDNPKLNTEALPGSEVLVGLLERTGHNIQKSILKSLEMTNPDSARTVKSKLVSTDTLKYLRDGQLLEVVLSLKHEELVHFLKGAPADVKSVIFTKSPKDLVAELEEELALAPAVSRETYQNIERKVLNRMKVMANDGLINLIETNERMFTDQPPDTAMLAENAAV